MATGPQDSAVAYPTNVLNEKVSKAGDTMTGALICGTTLRVNGNVGFYNTAPAAKPTVSGSRGANAALASLITALADLGLVTDSSS